MKTIIVATDFSTEANNAMEYAAALAQHTQARIILFNSYQLPESSVYTQPSEGEIRKLLQENREYLAGIALKLSERYTLEVDYWTNLTYVAEGLNELVVRYNADLVVMGVWKKAQEDILFGNTTTFVIQQANYPVLAIPDGYQFKGLRKILFAWDPSKQLSTINLNLLKEVAEGFNASVQIFHVSEELELVESRPRKQKMILELALRGIKHRYRNMEEEDILRGIKQGMQEFGADLLVMMPHKPDFGDAFFYESRTREMALRTKVPLLALPSTTE